jgi:hypothetical protein
MTTRHSFTEAVRQYLTDRPSVWVDARELQKIGGNFAWRTRVSDARKQLEKDGLGTIENQIQRKVYGHEKDCPAIQAWDIEGACQCSRPVVRTDSFYRYVPVSPVERSGGPHDLNADF